MIFGKAQAFCITSVVFFYHLFYVTWVLVTFVNTYILYELEQTVLSLLHSNVISCFSEIMGS